MQPVAKIYPCKVKQLDDTTRSFWAVASTGEVDRDGDRIDPRGWDLTSFRQNPVIAWAHDYSQPPVAKALDVRLDGDRLCFKPQFATKDQYPFADTIYRLYAGGFLSAFSVGFRPLDARPVTRLAAGHKIVGTDYLKQELFEISCVTVPANPGALLDAHKEGVLDGPTMAKLISAPQVGQKPATGSGLLDPQTLTRHLVEGIVDHLVAKRVNYHLGIVD